MKKKGIKRTLKTAQVLYLVLLILAASFSFAWFFENGEVSFGTDEGNNIQLSVGSNLEMSVDDGSTWSSSVDFTASSSITSEISGDGSTFVYPVSSTSFDTFDNPNGYYIEFNVKFRSETPSLGIYLGQDSAVSPVENINGSSLEREATDNDNSLGFSKDGICAAVRVAFLEDTTVKNLWIPNDGYELRAVENGDDVEYSFDMSGRSEASVKNGYGYVNNTAGTAQYFGSEAYAALSSSELSSGFPVTVSDNGNSNLAVLSGNTYLANQSVKLVSTSATAAADGKHYETPALKIRIWFEGTDREASSVLNGGKVKYTFSFLGITKDTQTTPAVEYDENNSRLVFSADNSAVDNSVIYSLDGYNWQTYGTNKTISANASAQTVYVRSKETADEFSGSLIKVVVPATSGGITDSDGSEEDNINYSDIQ